MEYKAYAKINLTLDVVKKRDDGFHELDMMMVPITLHDTLKVSFSDHDEIICGTNQFPNDETNTIYKAIQLMRDSYAFTEHFKVEVTKCIPMQAGLAGGSADGAAMLRAINEMCHLDKDLQELIPIAKKIGADVPFCLLNTSARVKGIGEKIEPFSIESDFYIVLVKPEEGVSTKEAFAGIDFEHCLHPDVSLTQQALLDNNYELFCSSIGNTLEQSAMQITPEVQMIKEELYKENFDAVLMSGSGSSVFALTKDKEKAKEVVEELQMKYDFVCMCKIEGENENEND